MIFEQDDVPAMEEVGRRINAPLSDRKAKWIQGEISTYDAQFLAGLVHAIKPKFSVEIGVASGWSSSVLLNTLAGVYSEAGDNAEVTWLTGVDLSPDLYTDKTIATGAAVNEVVPDLSRYYSLKTGIFSYQAMPEVGDVDFAFIDAHHCHPWAALDLIAVLPYLRADAWVAFHDLNLCSFERHNHRNRAPYYMFYLWPGRRIHSTQIPTMIGAIQIEGSPAQYLDTVFEILCTPWEIALPQDHIDKWISYVETHFGETAAARFAKVCEIANLKA